jgi:hypothetical protein
MGVSYHLSAVVTLQFAFPGLLSSLMILPPWLSLFNVIVSFPPLFCAAPFSLPGRFSALWWWVLCFPGSKV